MICATFPLQLVADLLSEVVLSCKEANQKSRIAGNEILIAIAHAMDEAQPSTISTGAPSAAGCRPPLCFCGALQSVSACAGKTRKGTRPCPVGVP